MEKIVENKKRLNVILSLSINYFSSIAIIQVNKYIYVKYKFPNMALTCLHFILTFLGLLICSFLGAFQINKLPLLKMIPMAISFCGFVALTNYSLQFNSIGTYQCLKSLTTPGVMIISMYYYKHSYSTKVKLSVIPVLLGVVLNSIYDLKVSFIGLFFGISAAAITSLYQVWIGEKQKELKINALQLLFYQAPLSAVILAFLIPFFEPLAGPNSIFDLNRSHFEWGVLVASGLIAFLVNISIYWIIGITSALTYNMSGNLKFVTTIIVGSILFEDSFKLEQMASIAMVTLGLIAYTHFRLQETSKKESETNTQEQTSLEAPLIEESKNQNFKQEQSQDSNV